MMQLSETHVYSLLLELRPGSVTAEARPGPPFYMNLSLHGLLPLSAYSAALPLSCTGKAERTSGPGPHVPYTCAVLERLCLPVVRVLMCLLRLLLGPCTCHHTWSIRYQGFSPVWVLVCFSSALLTFHLESDTEHLECLFPEGPYVNFEVFISSESG
eukprot:g82998.t1